MSFLSMQTISTRNLDWNIWAISSSLSRRQKSRHQVGGHTTDQEIQLLVIHGILHLSGYDHDTPQRQKKMWKLQSELLKEINNPLSASFQND